MEEQRIAIEPEVLESPIESEETAEKDQLDMVKPVKVRLIDYPPGFKSRLYKGRTFSVEGEVFEVYHEMDKKNGRPRGRFRGLGILAIMEESKPETGKGAENHE